MKKETDILLDASVIVKWFSKEEESEKAIALRDKHINGEIKIAIADITIIKVLDTLHYKKKDKEGLKKANADLYNIHFKIIKTNKKILDKTIELSLEHNLPFYKSLNLALAELYNISLVTAELSLNNFRNLIALEKT